MPERSNKTALITGASNGLGFEFANQLAAKGYNLIITARRKERLEEAANKFRTKHRVDVKVLPADISELSDIEQVISVINDNPDIELLVNNAGFGIGKSFFRAEKEIELDLLQVHMIAPVLFCRAIIPAMASRKRGVIINVSSMAGIVPVRSVLYGSTKSFLISFSESLQDELMDFGIRVQVLCPGFTITEFHDSPQFSRFKRDSIPRFLWMSSEKVVTESLNSLDNHQVICIPGNIYKVVGVFARNSFTAGLIRATARYILRRRNR